MTGIGNSYDRHWLMPRWVHAGSRQFGLRPDVEIIQHHGMVRGHLIAGGPILLIDNLRLLVNAGKSLTCRWVRLCYQHRPSQMGVRHPRNKPSKFSETKRRWLSRINSIHFQSCNATGRSSLRLGRAGG